MIELENAREIAKDWAAYMEIDPYIFEIQVGTFAPDMLTEDANIALAEMPEGTHAYGVTVGSPDNSRFIIGISDKCPPEKLEHVIIHELVHVYSFSAVGNDERGNMELLTDQCAMLIKRLRDLEAA